MEVLPSDDWTKVDELFALIFGVEPSSVFWNEGVCTYGNHTVGIGFRRAGEERGGRVVA